jgi:hypothetical protein
LHRQKPNVGAGVLARAVSPRKLTIRQSPLRKTKV